MLTGEDISAWRGNTGQWQVVGDVFLSPTNEKLLNAKPGTGVIVNGPKGRTSHLLSKEDFGDIKAHIDIVMHGKAGTAMQAYANQLSDTDVAAVVTYERNAFGNSTGDVVQPTTIKAAR